MKNERHRRFEREGEALNGRLFRRKRNMGSDNSQEIKLEESSW